MLISPIQITVYFIWLFDFLGISFLFGIMALIIFIVINILIQRQIKKYYTKILAAKDERMKIISETFNTIKLLKLYAWDKEFLNRVN